METEDEQEDRGETAGEADGADLTRARAESGGSHDDVSLTVEERVEMIQAEMESMEWNPTNTRERQRYWAARFGVSEGHIRTHSAEARRNIKRKLALRPGTNEHIAAQLEFLERARQRGTDAFESGHHNASVGFMEIEKDVGGLAPLPPTPQALIVQNFGSVPEYQLLKKRVVSAGRRLDAAGRELLQRAIAGEFDAEDGNT